MLALGEFVSPLLVETVLAQAVGSIDALFEGLKGLLLLQADHQVMLGHVDCLLAQGKLVFLCGKGVVETVEKDSLVFPGGGIASLPGSRCRLAGVFTGVLLQQREIGPGLLHQGDQLRDPALRQPGLFAGALDEQGEGFRCHGEGLASLAKPLGEFLQLRLRVTQGGMLSHVLHQKPVHARVRSDGLIQGRIRPWDVGADGQQIAVALVT